MKISLEGIMVLVVTTVPVLLVWYRIHHKHRDAFSYGRWLFGLMCITVVSILFVFGVRALLIQLIGSGREIHLRARLPAGYTLLWIVLPPFLCLGLSTFLLLACTLTHVFERAERLARAKGSG